MSRFKSAKRHDRNSFEHRLSLAVHSTIEQPTIFSFRDAVAAVGGFFQRAAISDGDAPPCHTQNATLLKSAERVGDASATCSQHQGEKLMRQADGVAAGAVVRHQQPAGKPFLNLVTAI